jgi:uncharacterized protein YdeI (YjbR/CyaY-like superfamily)
MIKTENFEQVEITSREELRDWLLKHHSQSESVWLVTFKKSNAGNYVSRWEVLDELICFGWIDGIRRKLDDVRTMQLISPRRVEHWAQSYKDRAAALIAGGSMHASGLQAMEASKSSGLWDFMEDVDRLVVPDDLSRELVKHEGATEFFHAIHPASKRFALRWVKLAKTESTRKNRITKLAALAQRGEKLPGS